MGNSKMNARERIDYLFDDHSFVEVGGYVSARNTDYNLGAKKVEGDGVITGYGVINDRMVYVYSQDASALGGSVGEMHAKKIASLYDLAMKTGAPIIGMLDCAGLRLQEATDALHAFGTIFNKQAQASVGMMDAEQAVRIMYAEEINTDKNKTALIAEKTAEYAEGQSSALAAAKRGYIDDIIEPDATRKRLIAAYEMLYGKKVTPVTKKHTAV